MSSEGLRTFFARTDFLKSAPSLVQSPIDCGYEVAFIGRSNAGKSSALNALTGKQLARTSKSPGRTQCLQFFRIDDDRRLVDLPGYGFAKIAKNTQVQIEWLLEDYLVKRHCLQGLFLLMDIRHPLTPFDKAFLKSMAPHRPIHILLTKCDKLSRNQRQQTLYAMQKAVAKRAITLQLFSVPLAIGISEAHSQLAEWLSVPTNRLE